jgi:hypothetical protein
METRGLAGPGQIGGQASRAWIEFVLLQSHILSQPIFMNWIFYMGRWRRVQQRTQFLRVLVRYVELTSEDARNPECHMRLLTGLRCQLADLETEEAALHRRYRTVRRLVGFVFGKTRTI